MTDQEIITKTALLAEEIRTKAEAQHCLLFLVHEPKRLVFPSFHHVSDNDVAVAAMCLRYGLPPNFDGLHHVAHDVLTISTMTNILLVLFYKTDMGDSILSYTNCSEELWRMILGNVIVLGEKKATIH